MQELEYYEKYGNNAAPGATMDEVRPGYSDYTKIDPNGSGDTEVAVPSSKPESTGSSENTNKTTTSTSTSTTKKSSGTKTTTTKSTTKKTATSKVNTDVLWQGSTVSVKTWGFHSSVIVVDGKEQTVLTNGLSFSEKVNAKQRLAYVHAPRTGKCSLREKASDKANVIKKLQAGTIVQVLNYGSSFCQVAYNGKVGYVLTSCLKFADPNAEPMCTWQLSYNGKTNGAAQVPIRNERSNDSASVMRLRSGTEVTVFRKIGYWYEIEYEGMHGFVNQNFLRMEE